MRMAACIVDRLTQDAVDLDKLYEEESTMLPQARCFQRMLSPMIARSTCTSASLTTQQCTHQETIRDNDAEAEPLFRFSIGITFTFKSTRTCGAPALASQCVSHCILSTNVLTCFSSPAEYFSIQ